MAVKKTIAIAGATEEVFIALANKLVNNNYRVLLLSSDKNELSKTLKDIKNKVKAEIELIDCIKEGCWEADIIVLAVPPYAQKEVAEKIKEVATQKIVISISDYENQPDDEIKELQRLLPHSKVVNASNTSQSIEAFIAADEYEAVKTISEIIRTAGFDQIPAGNISENSTLEHHFNYRKKNNTEL